MKGKSRISKAESRRQPGFWVLAVAGATWLLFYSQEPIVELGMRRFPPHHEAGVPYLNPFTADGSVLLGIERALAASVEAEGEPKSKAATKKVNKPGKKVKSKAKKKPIRPEANSVEPDGEDQDVDEGEEGEEESDATPDPTGAGASGVGGGVLPGPVAEVAAATPAQRDERPSSPGGKPGIDLDRNYFSEQSLLSTARLDINAPIIRDEEILNLPFVGVAELERYQRYFQRAEGSLGADSLCEIGNLAPTCFVQGGSGSIFSTKEEFMGILGLSEGARRAVDPLIRLSSSAEKGPFYRVDFDPTPFSTLSFKETVFLGETPVSPLLQPLPANHSWSQVIGVDGATGVGVAIDQFDTEEGFDFLTVSDARANPGDRRLSRLHGPLGEFFFAYQTNRLRLEVNTDDSVPSQGFKIRSISAWYEELPSLIRVPRTIELVDGDGSKPISDLVITQLGAASLDLLVSTLSIDDAASRIEVTDRYGTLIKEIKFGDPFTPGYLFAPKRPATDRLTLRFRTTLDGQNFKGSFRMTEYAFQPEKF